MLNKAQALAWVADPARSGEELRRACVARGLAYGGARADLVVRLQASLNTIPADADPSGIDPAHLPALPAVPVPPPAPRTPWYKDWRTYVMGGLAIAVIIALLLLVSRSTPTGLTPEEAKETAEAIANATIAAQPPVVETRVVVETQIVEVTPAGIPTMPPSATEVPGATPAPTATTQSGNAAFNQQGQLDGTGFVDAGADFFAIETREVGEGFNELLYATNGDACTEGLMQWKFAHDPTAELAGQWSDCDRLGVLGTGQFLFVIKNVTSGDLHFRMGGLGKYAVNGNAFQDFGDKDVPVDVPTGSSVTIGVSIANGLFYLQRTPSQLTVGGNFVFEEVGDGWFRLKQGSNSPEYCAWSAQWRITVEGTVTMDWPICVQLNLSGTGTVTITIKPDSEGYDTANISQLGLALWPMGTLGSYDVLLKDGTTWDRGILLDTGSDGIDLPLAGGPRTFMVHLTGGRAEIPLGDITRDLSQPGQPIVEPLR